jgi:hypothetical protein
MSKTNRRPTQAEIERFRDLFEGANSLGASTFGALWMQATQDLVGMLKESGFADALENDYALRAGVARGLYRVLATATKHPNNLAHAKSLIELRITAAQNANKEK